MPAHAGFIVAAYAVTGLVLVGMVLAIRLDHRAQRRALAMLSERLGRDIARTGAGASASRDADHEP